MNRTIQNLKTEIETIKKPQRKTTLELENLGKRSGVIDASITNRIQEIEERISGAEDTTENIDTTVKENTKSKKLLTQNIQEIQDTMRRPNLRKIGIEESEPLTTKITGSDNHFSLISLNINGLLSPQ
jgi:wobble nucleotide-excising tRNase